MASDLANPVGVGVAMRAGTTNAKSSATSKWRCSRAARIKLLGAEAAAPKRSIKKCE